MSIRFSFPWLREAAIWSVLTLSLFMTLMAWLVASQYRERETAQRFQESVEAARQGIQQRMAAYQSVLRSGAGFLIGSGEVTRDQWRDFVQSLQLDKAYPGIQGLGYAAMVPASGREALESTVRGQGLTDFSIHPKGSREFHGVIVYLEPLDWRNRRAIGYDMYAEQVRREAMERARDSGTIALSGRVTLLQETDRDVQPGCLMYLPLYREGRTPMTLDERKSELTGFVYGAFRMGDLMHGILGSGLKGLHFELYDGAVPRPEALLYSSRADVDQASFSESRSAAALGRPRYSINVPIDLAGRTWTARFASSPGFEESESSIQPALIGGGGVLADLLLFAALLTISRNGRQLALKNTELSASREALVKERSRFHLAVEAAPLAMVMVDEDGRIVLANAAMEKVFGYPSQELLGQTIELLLPPRAREMHSGFRDDYMATPEGRQMGPGRDLRGLHKDGSEIAVEVGLSPVDTQSGRFVVAAIADITQRQQHMDAIRERELRYRAVVETSPDGFWLVDRQGRLTGCNEAYSRMSGYRQDELLGLSVPQLEAKEKPEETAAHIEKILQHGYDRFESLHRRKDGSVWPVEITVSMNPVLGDMIVFVRDLTAFKAMEAERAQSEKVIRDLAFLDPLTQLPNRRLLYDRLQQALASARRSRRHGALLFIDMDHFKLLNDSLGHEMGDKLLVEVARRLTACVREGDTVARLGGDEFVVMLTGLSDGVEASANQVRQVGEKILEMLNRAYQLGEHVYFSTPSIGATLFRDEKDGLDAIFKRADAAMYQVKLSGRNAVKFFDEGMEITLSDRVLLEQCLSDPKPANKLDLHCQPIFDRDGHRVGVEALVRWQHPYRGLLPPAEFLEMAEDGGLIVRLSRHVLTMAFARLAKWAEVQHLSELYMTVNISARHLHQPGFVDEIRTLL
jgi:diguanylate cyclase (GGDEF)-like protein/PAS domain S-box-containing protein